MSYILKGLTLFENVAKRCRNNSYWLGFSFKFLLHGIKDGVQLGILRKLFNNELVIIQGIGIEM